jgi:superfamily II DNA/RNA helicase
VSIVRTSIDRPEIAYIRKVIPTNQKRQFRYLYFLVKDAAEEAKPSPLTIPKSLLFFESRDIMHNCVTTIRNWLITKYGYSLEQARKTVVAYHENVAQYDKTLLYAEFKKEDSRLRIVCGTDAISTDLDVPDVSRVIQVGMERDCDVNILLQRLGRGGRKGQQALGIFFIEAQ